MCVPSFPWDREIHTRRAAITAPSLAVGSARRRGAGGGGSEEQGDNQLSGHPDKVMRRVLTPQEAPHTQPASVKYISAEVVSRRKSLDAGLDAGSIVCITVPSFGVSEVNTHCFRVHKCIS